MIITQLMGGLGNQMFRYAAGLALAEKHGTVLKLDPSWYGTVAGSSAHERYRLGCFNITEQFAAEEEVHRFSGWLSRPERWSLALARLLRLQHYARRMQVGHHIYEQNGFGYDPALLDQPDSTYLAGSWQCERYFADIADLLRLHFTFRYPQEPAVAAMAQRIQAGPSAFVHFRRGDYGGSAPHGLLSLDYYRAALNLLYAKHPEITVYVFSDAIEEIEKQFPISGPHVFVPTASPWQAHDDLRLMSLCQHAIIANSTFSWWAAWLNRYPGKLVIAPDPWLADPTLDSSQVVPTGWVRLSVRWAA